MDGIFIFLATHEFMDEVNGSKTSFDQVFHMEITIYVCNVIVNVAMQLDFYPNTTKRLWKCRHCNRGLFNLSVYTQKSLKIDCAKHIPSNAMSYDDYGKASTIYIVVST
ncbi:CLUMA_CG012726, isoform A [Clunio marinus]|uniref:CLUMA_CG012726, isoform A n=1 Tax=Clunio marinus TaxID=568069 RepID=A0A1J1IGQ8_9DIPT|nr:CLUMA_CG012726, isoform A [Clunio marinus]